MTTKKSYTDKDGILEGFEINNNKVGEWIRYSHDGTVRAKMQYNENGQKHGEYESYYKNGVKEQLGKYTDGMLDGLWKEFNIQGELISEKMVVRKFLSLLELNYIFRLKPT